ncbi:MAG: serine hydrolase [Ferruginibacter sp.]
MKLLTCILLLLMANFPAFCQIKVPPYFRENPEFTNDLKKIISDLNLDSSFATAEDGPEQISFAVVDLTGKSPVFAGVNATNFIYPASVYKMYVAMEILKQVSEKNYSLYRTYIVSAPNDVDKIKEISNDPRPLLKAGDSVTVNYLLDLMITRSDNTAANCLIDLAGRKNINLTIERLGWTGSEITRKFLKRKFEDAGYDTVRGTQTCALHAADFMYRVFTGKLINPWVSMQLKVLLGRQLDNTKLATGLPSKVMYYHKTGWWSNYTHDVGIVDDGKLKYVVAIFTPLKETDVSPVLKILSEKIYNLIAHSHR